MRLHQLVTLLLSSAVGGQKAIDVRIGWQKIRSRGTAKSEIKSRRYRRLNRAGEVRSIADSRARTFLSRFSANSISRILKFVDYRLFSGFGLVLRLVKLARPRRGNERNWACASHFKTNRVSTFAAVQPINSRENGAIRSFGENSNNNSRDTDTLYKKKYALKIYKSKLDKLYRIT